MTESTQTPSNRSLTYTLWALQGLLAALFLFAGGMKLALPLDKLTGPLPVSLPGWFMRFIGFAEVFGGLGLVLPGLTGIQPGLTPLAAAGLAIIMIGATVITFIGDAGPLFPLITGLLLVFVAYGRWRLAPHHGS
ncbi:MAG: DoxX family protein [Deltaproteobacteria bacterium]|nr:DoxX family protein [Deltaproteobacteria bacterium]